MKKYQWIIVSVMCVILSLVIMSFLPLNMVYLSEVEQRGDQSYEDSIAVNLPLLISEKQSEASHVMEYKLVGDELMSTIGLFPNDSYLPEYQKILKNIPFYKRPDPLFIKLFENQDQTIWTGYFTEKQEFPYRMIDQHTKKIKDFSIKLDPSLDTAFLDGYTVEENELTLYLRIYNKHDKHKFDTILKSVIDIQTGKVIKEEKINAQRFDAIDSVAHTGNVFQPEYIVGHDNIVKNQKDEINSNDYAIYNTHLNKISEFTYQSEFKANAYQLFIVKDTIYILESDYNDQRDTLSFEDEKHEVEEVPEKRKYILSKLDKNFKPVKVTEFEGNISDVKLKDDKLMVLSKINEYQIEAQLLTLESGNEVYAIRWHLASKDKYVEPLGMSFVN